MTQKRLESCVTAAEAGWPTGRFLAERMQVSKRQLARLKLLDDGIWVNGTHATVRRVLQTGDRVSVRSEAKTASPIVPRAQELAIVYEDEALLVLDKPAGQAVYPRYAGDVDNLASGVLAYWQTQAGPDVFRPLLRLDKGHLPASSPSPKMPMYSKNCRQRPWRKSISLWPAVISQLTA